MNTDIIPGSIVVGADGSDAADRAIHWAAEQAWLERRHLTVVTAAEHYLDGSRGIVNVALAMIARMRPGVEADGCVVVGDPREVLVELSPRAHLLVLGSRGHGPVRSKLLGSVSAAVSRDATCPVVVCRPHHWRSANDIDAGVLVGADGTAESLPVIEHAFQQASLRGLPLTVVHCTWDGVVALTGPAVLDPQAVGMEEERLLLAESVAGFTAKFPEVHVELQVARGLAEQVLAAGSARWDLVVVGRHPVDTFARRAMGAVSTSVVEHAHTSVAVVPQAVAVH
ncbi:MAG TPA: universal stress protein [Nocardioides sp.]|nr:universal stress protein [Nocardioides sp.]